MTLPGLSPVKSILTFPPYQIDTNACFRLRIQVGFQRKYQKKRISRRDLSARMSFRYAASFHFGCALWCSRPRHIDGPATPESMGPRCTCCPRDNFLLSVTAQPLPVLSDFLRSTSENCPVPPSPTLAQLGFHHAWLQ